MRRRRHPNKSRLEEIDRSLKDYFQRGWEENQLRQKLRMQGLGAWDAMVQARQNRKPLWVIPIIDGIASPQHAPTVEVVDEWKLPKQSASDPHHVVNVEPTRPLMPHETSDSSSEITKKTN